MRNLLLISLLFLTFVSNCFATGCDSDTRALWHFNEADTSTTFAEENCDSSGAHVATAVDDAQTDSGNTKFSNTLLLDGTGDYVTVPDSTDFDMFGDTTSDWTLDWWINLAVEGGGQWMFQQGSASDAWKFNTQSTNRMENQLRTSNVNRWEMITANEALQGSSWHHIAFVKVGGSPNYEIGLYIDGTQFDYKSSSFGLSAIMSVFDNKKSETLTSVYVIPIGEIKKSLQVADKFRKAEINTDIDIIYGDSSHTFCFF